MKLTKDRLKEIIYEEISFRKEKDLQEEQMLKSVTTFICENKKNVDFSKQNDEKMQEIVEEGVLEYFQNRIEDFKKRLLEEKNISTIKSILKEINLNQEKE